MKRFWIIVGLLAAGGLSAAYFLHASRHRAESSHENNPVRTVVENKPVAGIVAASGSLSSNGDIVINCMACGEVARLPFSVGDRVKKGDLLCQLDPAMEQNCVDQASLALSRAKRKLEETKQSARQAAADLQISIQQAEENIESLHVKSTNTQNKAGRQKQLLSQSLTSQEEFESAETEAAGAAMEYHNAVLAKQELINRSDMIQTEKQMDIEAVEEQVESDENALKSAQDRLKATTMISPIDGVVSDLKIGPNTWIPRSGDNDRFAIMTISDMSKLFANVAVDEREIGSVRAGEKVQIASQAFPGRSFSGVVAQIAPTGVQNQNVVKFGVKIEVTSADKEMLKPPMTADVKILQQPAEGVSPEAGDRIAAGQRAQGSINLAQNPE